MMETLSTTRMSSKGQVVIPEAVRDKLGLKSGAQFIVVSGKDTIILKSISPPPPGEFRELLKTARDQAKKAGMKPADVQAAIRKVRKRT